MRELSWVTHSDGAMHLSVNVGEGISHVSIQYRHDSDKQVLLDMVAITLRLKGVLD